MALHCLCLLTLPLLFSVAVTSEGQSPNETASELPHFEEVDVDSLAENELKARIRSMVEDITVRVQPQSERDHKGNSLHKRLQEGNDRRSVTRMSQRYLGLRVYGAEVIERAFFGGSVELKDKAAGDLTVLNTEASRDLGGKFMDPIDQGQSILKSIDISQLDPVRILDWLTSAVYFGTIIIDIVLLNAEIMPNF